MLNVNRLRVLIEVANRGSFSAAADALSYTQSAVSQQIAALETETGVNLIERLPRGVRLTPAGRVLLEHAEGIVARLHAAEAEMAAIAGLRGGQLRMASFPTAGATLMPLAIAIFRAQHPEVAISLAEGEPEEIGPRLSAGEFDIALLFEFDGTSESLGPDITREPLLEDPMFLALPADHPLAERRTLRLENLRAEAWIQTSSTSSCARHVVRSCHGAGFEPLVSFESDDYADRPGARRRGRRRRAHPRARAFGRPRRHRHPRAVAAQPGAASDRRHARRDPADSGGRGDAPDPRRRGRPLRRHEHQRPHAELSTP